MKMQQEKIVNHKYNATREKYCSRMKTQLEKRCISGAGKLAVQRSEGWQGKINSLVVEKHVSYSSKCKDLRITKAIYYKKFLTEC